jgi:hypothetical protein
VEVLFEETKEIEGKTYLVGHSREYVPCCVEIQEHIQTGEIRTGKGLRLLEGNVLCLALS